ncbi:hypothetical protein LOC71_05055 [Rhodopirellula sp. JC740]|uniref:Uncharacterized protein n=1 Tax=Rhodopirellula halodulae TaxID=2894198 RepID=A0ABS8NDK7_9BACT|nr:hypothetical protein [Rhodopirellula sp. JC740]MCC9641633.1 hypothetical protein [Rhodopirellula sp. JC740]
MTKRTAYLSPSNLGGLHAYREVSRIIDEVGERYNSELPTLNVDALFGASMVQSGVDRFMLLQSERDTIGDSKFIDDKTDTIAPKEIDDLYRVVFDVVDSQTIGRRDDESRSTASLAGHLVDLIVAARYRMSLVVTLPPADLEEYRQFLRPEFFAAIEILFSNLETEVAATPVPQSAIKASDVRRLNSILSSDLFVDYRDAQTAIDNPRTVIAENVKRASSTARSLTRGFSDQLSLQSLVLSGLSITGYAIELFMGKLPATAISPFKRVYQSYFIDDHRVLIYDFSAIWSRSFSQQLEPWAREYRDAKTKA